jgi:hypothetical protein
MGTVSQWSGGIKVSMMYDKRHSFVPLNQHMYHESWKDTHLDVAKLRQITSVPFKVSKQTVSPTTIEIPTIWNITPLLMVCNPYLMLVHEIQLTASRDVVVFSQRPDASGLIAQLVTTENALLWNVNLMLNDRLVLNQWSPQRPSLDLVVLPVAKKGKYTSVTTSFPILDANKPGFPHLNLSAPKSASNIKVAVETPKLLQEVTGAENYTPCGTAQALSIFWTFKNESSEDYYY